MKKFFGVLLLSVGFILASCGLNDFSGSNGELSFSISNDDLGKIAARNATGDSAQAELTLIVQIQGSKGLYDRQIKKTVIAVDPNAERYEQSQVMDPYEIGKHHYIAIKTRGTDAEKLSFSFSSLPVKQKYNIMLDVIVNDQRVTEGHNNPYHCYTGVVNEVEVKAKESTAVQIRLTKDFEEVAFKVNYSDGETEIIPFSEFMEPKYVVSVSENKLYIGKIGGTGKSVNSVKVVYSENSNFKAKGSFSLDYDRSQNGQDHPYLKSVNGEVDITQALLEANDYRSFNFVGKIADVEYKDYFYLPISKGKDSFIQSHQYNLVFKKEPIGEGGNQIGYRFRATIPWSDLLKGRSYKQGDTIVFIMEGEPYHPLFDKTEAFQFKFQKSGWEQLSVNEVDLGVNYMKIPKENGKIIKPLVFPANFVNGDEKYLQIFFDTNMEFGKPADSEQIVVCQFYTRVFDKEEKVYAFYNNYSSDMGRYEMNIPLNDTIGNYDFTGKTLKVKVGGTLELTPYDSLNNTVSLPGSIPLHTEFYDNSSASNCTITSGHSSHYHPLSNDDNGNEKDLTVTPGGTINTFKMVNLSEPCVTPDPNDESTNHDYRFQCYSALNGDIPDAILYVKGYSLTPTFED
ncbi:MAG: hypothetical protein K5907_02635 [Treponema sp.]|nr:hypothetical protein [Treponema sp.]